MILIFIIWVFELFKMFETYLLLEMFGKSATLSPSSVDSTNQRQQRRSHISTSAKSTTFLRVESGLTGTY